MNLGLNELKKLNGERSPLTQQIIDDALKQTPLGDLIQIDIRKIPIDIEDQKQIFKKLAQDFQVIKLHTDIYDPYNT